MGQRQFYLAAAVIANDAADACVGLSLAMPLYFYLRASGPARA